MRWRRSPQREGGRPRGTHHKRTRAGHRAGEASHRGCGAYGKLSGWPSHEPEVFAARRRGVAGQSKVKKIYFEAKYSVEEYEKKVSEWEGLIQKFLMRRR